MKRPVTVGERIAERTREYAELPLFCAFREDRIPEARFPAFFKEQFMTARGFQDVIWAATEISEGPYAEFAREHRGRDSGHYRWMRHDLWNFGLGGMTEDDWFRFEWLPTRIQMARILGRLHGAAPDERVIVLACMENAGGVTLDPLLEPGRRVPGFLSHRAEGGRLSPRIKRYLPDVPFSRLDGLPSGWAPTVEFAARRLGYASAGHVGAGPGGFKVYVERTGSIATDFSAR